MVKHGPHCRQSPAQGAALPRESAKRRRSQQARTIEICVSASLSRRFRPAWRTGVRYSSTNRPAQSPAPIFGLSKGPDDGGCKLNGRPGAGHRLRAKSELIERLKNVNHSGINVVCKAAKLNRGANPPVPNDTMMSFLEGGRGCRARPDLRFWSHGRSRQVIRRRPLVAGTHPQTLGIVADLATDGTGLPNRK
jgi:hypothetical protein